MEELSKHPNPRLDQCEEEFQPHREDSEHSKSPRPSSFLSTLPVELQLCILDFLNYRTLRNLSQTNKHFRSILVSCIGQGIIRDSLLALETDRDLQRTLRVDRTRYPCYGCLRILVGGDYFGRVDTNDRTCQRLGAKFARNRRCMSCRYSDLTNGKESQLFVDHDQFWVACAVCRQVKHYVETNRIEKIAWDMWRRCAKCAKKYTDEEEVGEYVGETPPVEGGYCVTAGAVPVQSILENFEEELPKQARKSWVRKRWLAVRRLLTLAK